MTPNNLDESRSEIGEKYTQLSDLPSTTINESVNLATSDSVRQEDDNSSKLAAEVPGVPSNLEIGELQESGIFDVLSGPSHTAIDSIAVDRGSKVHVGTKFIFNGNARIILGEENADMIGKLKGNLNDGSEGNF